jgi:hypothetical protein
VSDNTQEVALQVLDLFLFEDIYNNNNFNEREWQITWEGDNFVVRHWDTGTDYHFRVTIEPYEWDSTQARADQEWD